MPDTATNCLLVARTSSTKLMAEPLPLYESGVAAGFPSPADDHIDRALDVRELLIRRPAATFYCRADGDSMRGTIHDGDVLVVDRSVEPAAGDVVVAVVDGGLVVKRLFRRDDGTWILAPDNLDFPPLAIDPAEGVQIWGVVTWALTNLCAR